MGKALWWILGGVAVVGGTAAVIIVNKKKKKKEEDAKKQDSNGGSTSKKTSNGVLYSGINKEQTKALQQKLNAFIASGALGQVMELFGLEGGSPQEFIFKTDLNDKPYYRHRYAGATIWSSWCNWWTGYANDGSNTAYARWIKDGKPEGVIYPEDGGDPKIENPAKSENSDTATSNETKTSGGSAIEVFKNSITNALTNGALVVDGAYGKNTMAVVSALQIYLNATKKSGLTVDGKYGPKTDAATGWGIC